MARRMTHVGVVVRNIDEALELFTKVLGFDPPPAGIVDVPEAGVRCAHLPIGNNWIELLQSTNPDNDAAQILKERGEGLLHIAIEVDDVDAEVEALQAKGVDVIKIPPIGDTIDYTSAFVSRHSAKGVPLELLPMGLVNQSMRKLLGLEIKDEPLP